MRIKTTELTGMALDWAVARLESTALPTGMCNANILMYRSTATNAFMYKSRAIPYSTDWAQGGPILERENVSMGLNVSSTDRQTKYVASMVDTSVTPWSPLAWAHGPTPLIAAMRCYVASKLGDEVDVPDEVQ